MAKACSGRLRESVIEAVASRRDAAELRGERQFGDQVVAALAR
jgi:hypothetical protein